MRKSIRCICSCEKQSWEKSSVLTGIIQALRIKKKLTEFQVFILSVQYLNIKATRKLQYCRFDFF